MSDLEFQRALSPDQMRVALSLLDGTARAQLQNMQVGDSNPAEEGGCAADQANTSTAMPNRPPAAEGAHPRMNHLRFFADRAAKKWPLRGSLELGLGCL
jgi:hypothetical protein